jgi:hypothetical protein
MLKRRTARQAGRALHAGAVQRVTLLASALLALGLTAAAPAGASAMWNETTAPAVSTTNCISQGPEPLSTSSVGWFGDPAAPPQLNTVFYARVRWFVTGKPCIGGARVAPELFLPQGSTLAISATNPVKCYAINLQTGARTQETAGCPQAPAAGVRGGLGFYPVGQSGGGAWPTAQGFGWEIHVPMLATASLSGVVSSTNPAVPCADCLTAAVWSIDGVSSPWSYPRVGVRTAGSMTAPRITYPVPSVTGVTNTSAIGKATLDRAGTTGSVFIHASTTPPSGSTCNQSSNAIPVTAQDQASVTYTATFSQLAPGTDHFWRMCYVTGGRTFWGVNQVFRTTGTPRPRIFSLSPLVALPGRTVTITGADLTGATSVTINGAQTVSAQITGVTATTVTFVVPDSSEIGTVSVTTPGGTTTTSGGLGFRTGIETILDDATVGANDGVLQNDLTIHFHSTEPFPNAQFECILDGGPFASSCDAGVVFYNDLAPGTHSVQITARADGWTDWPPLVVPIKIVNSDTTPPNTTLLSGPHWYTNTHSATFTFSSEAGATFECSGDIHGLWVPCTSPYTRNGIAEGTHTFLVRAKDVAQNVDPTPAGTFYTVDTTPPETWILSAVPPVGTTTTTSRTATFVVVGTAPSNFQCSLDAAPFTACRATTFSGLATGPHTFRARAVDPAGNVDPTPVKRTWTIT